MNSYTKLFTFSFGLDFVVFGLFIGFISGLNSKRIQTQDAISLDLSKLKELLFFLLGLSLFFGLLGGFVVNLFFGLFFGLFIGLVFVFQISKYIKRFSSLENPYQRIKGGFLINLYFSLLLILLFIIGTVFSVLYLQNLDLLMGLLLLTTTLIIGIQSVLLQQYYEHFILRLCLYLEAKMPLKYATFLDYAADARILEKDGGHWRFRHQNLQDYFADLDEQTEV